MEVTMELILQAFKNFSDEKKMKDIKSYVVSVLNTENELLFDKQGEIELSVESLIKEDKKRDKESFLIYNNGKYKKRKNKKPLEDADDLLLDTRYIGAAGELAVMSELIFRGYNANRMTIDDGIDIIATKNNIYYYIQVKTTSIKNGRIHAQIPKIRFDQYISNQIRYIVVARYKDREFEKNMFFVFTPDKIQEGIHNGFIKDGVENINIKIKFNEKTGSPELYDEKTSDVSFYMNRFL